jgi:dCTP deaminase
VERPLIVNPADVRMEEFLDRYHKRRPIETDGSITLEPNKVLLGVTREYVRMPREAKIAARVEGRSTLARLGLMVHLTAPTIHCGFSGPIVLEMFNLSTYSLRLEPGRLAICQLIFERLGSVPRGPVRTRYQGQRGVR